MKHSYTYHPHGIGRHIWISRLFILIVSTALALMLCGQTPVVAQEGIIPSRTPNATGQPTNVDDLLPTSPDIWPSVEQSTQVISSRLGWQATPLNLQQGSTYYVTYRSGSWSIDYRTYPYSGPEGYSRPIDNKVGYWSFCKTVYSWPYAALLGRIGNGQVFFVGRGGMLTANATGGLNLRINDNVMCQGDNDGSIQVMLDSNTSPPCYALNISVAGGGTVKVLTPSNCPGGYTANTMVKLQAESNGSLYRFVSWSGDANGSSVIVNVTMTGPRTVAANFALAPQSQKPAIVLVHGWKGLGEKRSVQPEQ